MIRACLFRACLYCILFMICAATMSCGKRHMQLDHETRRAIDTLAAKEINVLRTEIDSLCKYRMDSLVLAMSDSIVAVRRKEIQQMIGK